MQNMLRALKIRFILSWVVVYLLSSALSQRVLHAQQITKVEDTKLLVAGAETNGVTGAPAAATSTVRWQDGDKLTGNWDSLRTKLQSTGIEPFVFYTAISSGNPRGGYSQGHVTAVDDFYMGTRLDLSRLIHWHGASVTISGVNRDGTGLSNAYIKSQFNVQQTVGGQSLFFYQFFLKKTLKSDRNILKIGRFGASDDFNASSIYGLYLNNGINGDIRNVLFDTQFSAYPFATWAAMFQTNRQNGVTFQAGVFQTWANIFNSETNGVDWTFHKGDGIIAMFQLEVTTHLHGQTLSSVKHPSPEASLATAKSIQMNSPDSRRLEGHYWIGSTFSPWKGYTQFNSTQKASNSYGVYLHGDQRVWEEFPGSRRSLILWGDVGVYPQQNISIVPYQANLGVVYQGMFSARPNDKTILGVIYGKFSRDYAQQQIIAGGGDPSYEAVLEVSHRLQFSKFLFAQPDFQMDVRPSGTGCYRNALVAGAEVGMSW